MNGEWSLDALYLGFDDPKYQADRVRLTALCAALNDLTGRLAGMEPAQALHQVLSLQEELRQLSTLLMGYSSLRQSTNSRDADAVSNMGQLQAELSSVSGANAAFEAYVAALPDLEPLLAADPFLADYRYLLESIRRDSRYLLPAREEEILSRMNISGGSAWSQQQGHLTSAVEVDFRGGKTNLSAIRNMAYDPDPALRRDAYEAELACYPKIADAVAFSLNSIKLQVIQECQLRGYDSPLDQTLQGARMERRTLDALLSAMNDYLPRFWKYLRVKARVLGHEGGLPWYDLFAPMGENSRKFTIESARDYLLHVFASFDGQLHDMAAQAFDEHWIDFYPHDGKRGGAFCSGLQPIRQSRILTNFDGSFSDVVTLAHELGHAFHNVNLYDHRPLNKSYSMPVAETASNFNECIVNGYAIRHARSDAEKLALIESQLSDTTQIICDILSRYLFETAVFDQRASRFMDSQALCGIMLNAQKQAYGDGLDHSLLHPYMWVCKSHYYSTGRSFYNFPYAFGGLFARGLYAQYEEEGSAFVPKYKTLLHTTSVASVEDTAKIAGLDLTDKAFWARGLESYAQMIDQFIALAQK